MVRFARGFSGRRERDLRLPPASTTLAGPGRTWPDLATWPVLSAEATPKLNTNNWPSPSKG